MTATSLELVDAIASGATRIEVEGAVSGPATLALSPGVETTGVRVEFKAKGLASIR